MTPEQEMEAITKCVEKSATFADYLVAMKREEERIKAEKETNENRN